jgi:serine/threonine-protein kinase
MIGREVIGQYRIEKKLGSGGMGTVYLAEQTSVSRPAVIKVLRLQGDSSEDGTTRFAIEAKAASSLNHPNIVTIYNYGQMEDGTLFLAMEYIEGETLADRLAKCGQLPVDRAVHIATQIASALGEAHAHGVVHRDLKPANIMLVPRAGGPDFVKVLDFGIAKVDDSRVTSTGYVVGTPRYMSPEQLLGKKLDCRSDIYSAGILLYEMLAGSTPFQSETPMGWLHQHVEATPKRPSELSKRGKIPHPIEDVVLRAIAKAPDERPKSMEMLSLDLVAALNAPIEPPPPPWWKRAAARSLAIAMMVLTAIATATKSVLRKTAKVIGSAARSGWRSIPVIASRLKAATRRRPQLAAAHAAMPPPAKPRAATPPRGAAAPARSAVAAARPANRAPARPAGHKSRWAWATATTKRRVLVAAVMAIVYAALIVALFPGVRADLGLGGKPSTGNAKTPTTPVARDRQH